MLEILKSGGVTVIPLLICSVVGLAVALERLIYLKRARGNNFKLLKKAKLKFDSGKFVEAKTFIEEERGPVAGILRQGMKYYGHDRDEIRINLDLIGQNEVKKLEKGLNLLDVIATVAPLLGLLGTVLGIIDSFNILAGAQGMASPSALSVGISQALISTAVGLIVAIPTMLMYSYLASLVDDRVKEINTWFVDLTDLLSQGDKNVQI